MQVHVILCSSDEGSLVSWDSDHEHLIKLRVIQCIHSTGECFLGFIPVWQKKNHNGCQVFSRAALGWAVLNFLFNFVYHLLAPTLLLKGQCICGKPFKFFMISQPVKSYIINLLRKYANLLKCMAEHFRAQKAG